MTEEEKVERKMQTVTNLFGRLVRDAPDEFIQAWAYRQLEQLREEYWQAKGAV